MSFGEFESAHSLAADAFNKQSQRADGARVAACLASGFTTLAGQLLDRISTDVALQYGADSMLMPVSAVRAEANERREIELYFAAESADFVRAGRHVGHDPQWYAPWVAQLRLGKQFDAQAADRLQTYLAKTTDARRLAFEGALERLSAETSRAPLILFRLLPLAVRIVTALALSDTASAEQIRKQQFDLLPSIADCHHCHARLMECGDECRHCGNPLWKIEWLTAE